MRKFLLVTCALLMWGGAMAQDVVVDRQTVVGKIKPMNGVNNAPKGPENIDGQLLDNYEVYRAAKFPFARTHDAALCENYGGQQAVDITAIFPDFDKNPNNPESYNFRLTDRYVERIINEGGSQVFFRMGQSIENHGQNFGVRPPKDFKKWAVVCEHIIRHYNEGWADGFHHNIKYWEIWNEPDLDRKDWQTAPRNWGGSPEAFFELFSITARHLKKCFPDLKIGGPAVAGDEEWTEMFLKNMSENNVPIDFFSWHIYSFDTQRIITRAERMRALCDKYGYTEAESILNEWNYIKNWTSDFGYSVTVMSSVKGAAFTAAVMSACQDSSVDNAMYYDARPYTLYNGLFDFYTQKPMPPYYSFYAWSRLSQFGNQAKVKVDAEKNRDLYAVAALNDKGALRLLLTRYNDDNNVIRKKRIKVDIGLDYTGEVMGYMVDSARLYTEIPLESSGGIIEVEMEPNAVLMIVAM